MKRSTAGIAVLLLNGCVAGTRPSPTPAQLAGEPPLDPGPPSAARWRASEREAPTPKQGEERPPRAFGAARGYWHYDGVRYEWRSMEPEAGIPSFSRR